jgi:hypothetical protein
MNLRVFSTGAATLALGVFALAFTNGMKSMASGPKVGGDVYPFEPQHVTGPDMNTNTCPVCKYGNSPAVQVWVNGDSTQNVVKIAQTLEGGMATHPKFHAFLVFLPEKGATKTATESKLKAIASKAHLKKVALVYITPASQGAIKEYQINTSSSVKNTVFFYSKLAVVDHFVNLKADGSGLQALKGGINKAVAHG